MGISMTTNTFSMRRVLVVLSLLAFGALVHGQGEDCSRWELQRCGACLRETTTCGWCESWASCVPLTEASFCGYGWKYPTGTTATSPATNDTVDGAPVLPLFNPASATLSLRKGITRTVSVTVTPRAMIPLDVYVLVDRTVSMASQLMTLRSLASSIASTVLNSTFASVHIGLGSFAEKPLAPFTDPAYTWPNGGSPASQATFMFRNDAPLADVNASAFGDAFAAMRPIGDYDVPHAGLDAMVQVALCDAKIGWRAGARKVLFVLTNAGYHVAMDGLRAGIELPAAKACAMSANSANIVDRDYPSVEMWRDVMYTSDIVPVFGIARSSMHLDWAYGAKSGLIGRLGRGFVMGLNDDFSDIPSEIAFSLKKIANTVHLYPDPTSAASSYISSIDPPIAHLMDDTGAVVSTAAIVTVSFVTPAHVVSTVTPRLLLAGHPGVFATTISAGYTYTCESCSGLSCPKDCNGRGTCECGRCVNCVGGFDGTECQFLSTSTCSTGAGVACSGHGTCDGYSRCKCDAGWTFQTLEGRVIPQFCDCPVSKCLADANGVECSGNGLCVCGKCRCLPGFDGANCGCETFKQCDVDCSAESDGRAECVCGKCQCKAPWFGDGCARCDPTDAACPYGKKICEAFQSDCGACVSHANGTECHWCGDVQACMPNAVLSTCKAPITPATQSACRCVKGCAHDVFYKYTSDGTVAYADVSKDKTSPGPAVGIAFACCIGAGVIIMLLWRVFVYYQDKEEWERFEFKCLELGVNATIAKDQAAKDRLFAAAAAAAQSYPAKRTDGIRVPVIEAAEKKRKQDEEDAKRNEKDRKKRAEKDAKKKKAAAAASSSVSGVDGPRTTVMEMNVLRQEEDLAAVADIMFANDNLFTM